MKDFFALKTIATIFRVLGIVNILITFVFLIILLLSPSYSLLKQFSIIRGGDILSIILFLFLSLVPALILFAISETIFLFLQIEKNTRKDSKLEMLTKIADSQSETVDNDFQEWKKKNQNKTLNDYYQQKRQI